MDTGKLNTAMQAMNNALGALERATELSQQTGRFRNMLTRSDLDSVSVLCVTAIKLLTEEMTQELKEE